jgi:ABC-type multidrug transport system ATPase subunit
MDLEARHISKHRGRQWILRNLSYTFHTNTIYGIAGSNGSGKSTLLQLLSGFLEPSEGQCVLLKGNKEIPILEAEGIFSVAAPYLSLIPHFTISEWLSFHFKFQGWSQGLVTEEILELSELSHHASKQIQALSSGMKQRLQLLTALASDVPFIFLDEPTSNLDMRSKEWFKQQLARFRPNKGVLIASNEAFDLNLCEETLQVEAYKN